MGLVARVVLIATLLAFDHARAGIMPEAPDKKGASKNHRQARVHAARVLMAQQKAEPVPLPPQAEFDNYIPITDDSMESQDEKPTSSDDVAKEMLADTSDGRDAGMAPSTANTEDKKSIEFKVDTSEPAKVDSSMQSAESDELTEPQSQAEAESEAPANKETEVQAKTETKETPYQAGAAVLQAASPFKGIFYINLDQDILRKENIEQELGEYLALTTRLPATTPDDLGTHEEFGTLVPKGCCSDDTYKCSKGARDDAEFHARSCACDFMHRVAYQRIAEQQEDGYYIVMEDDIQLKDGWAARVEQILKNVPSDWDMLRLGWFAHDNKQRDTVEEVPGWMRCSRAQTDQTGQKSNKYIDYYWGAFAVVLTPDKARALVKRTKEYAGDYADKFTSYEDDFKAYCSTDRPIGLSSLAQDSSRIDDSPHNLNSHTVQQGNSEFDTELLWYNNVQQHTKPQRA